MRIHSTRTPRIRLLIGLMLLLISLRSLSLGPGDELIAMIKSHNNQFNIESFITDHPEIKNSYVSGYTPLMHAIFEGLSDVAERLINTIGVDIHQKDHHELATALMYAVTYDLPDTVAALLHHGARLSDTDKRGDTVWAYVKKAERMANPHAGIIRTMLEQQSGVKFQ